MARHSEPGRGATNYGLCGRPTYERWIEQEGMPVHAGSTGVEDITGLPRRPWARLGGSGTFINLGGTRRAGKLLYVAEIPAGGALAPEKHLYEELIYILRGRGLAEVWYQGQSRVSFEWGEGSLFAAPLNAWHRLVNGGRQPVLVFGQSSAPLLMNALHGWEFIFDCPHNFTDLFAGKTDYFVAGEKRMRVGFGQGFFNAWETNFVPNLLTAHLDDQPEKVESGQVTVFLVAAWNGAHSSAWPVGVYHKAHYHGPGAVLLGLSSEGYVLLWHKQSGIHPFQDGHGGQVVKVNWKKNSIYSPQNDWFHQHFNTGKEQARHLATTGGGTTIALPSLQPHVEPLISVRDGGTLIEYEDEDPEIRRVFQEELRKNGVGFKMKPVAYRADPFRLPWA